MKEGKQNAKDFNATATE